MSQDCAVNTNLPLSPALSQWMDFHSSVLEGKGHLGRSKVQTYTKGQYTLAPGRYLPPDANTLYETPNLQECLLIHSPGIGRTDRLRW